MNNKDWPLWCYDSLQTLYVIMIFLQKTTVRVRHRLFLEEFMENTPYDQE